MNPVTAKGFDAYFTVKNPINSKCVVGRYFTSRNEIKEIWSRCHVSTEAVSSVSHLLTEETNKRHPLVCWLSDLKDPAADRLLNCGQFAVELTLRNTKKFKHEPDDNVSFEYTAVKVSLLVETRRTVNPSWPFCGASTPYTLTNIKCEGKGVQLINGGVYVTQNSETQSNKNGLLPFGVKLSLK